MVGGKDLTLDVVEAGAGEVAAAKFIAALPPLLLLWITEVLLRQTTQTPAPASTASAAAAARVADSAGQAADSPDTLAAVVAAHLSGGGQVADAELTAAVAEHLAVSERTARRRLEPYRTTGEPAAAPRALSVVTDPDNDVEEALR